VAASAYQPFPTYPRTALPIDLADAQEVEEPAPPAGMTGDAPAPKVKVLVVEDAATDVALIALPGNVSGLGIIEGMVDASDPGGVLVVAEQGGRSVSSAVSDAAGAFTLFNVPPGSTVVAGYRAGLNITPQTVTAKTLVQNVVLHAVTTGLGTVSGSVEIVNAPGGSVTTVILAVDSTFDPAAARGEVPAGLRAAQVTGAFSIVAVPPGTYVVLAAFENDNLVRDPDQSIGGTALVRVTVPDTGGAQSLAQSFKVTEALAVVSPGRDQIDKVSGTPTFTWADDSSEDGYEFRIFDSLGQKVFEDLNVPRVTGSANVTYTPEGLTLKAGTFYQFRVLSYKTGRHGSARTYLSATEDLRGVFIYGP
jgi:hypothetical protein